MTQLIRYNAIRVADKLSDQLDAATIAANTALTQEDLQEKILSQMKRMISGDGTGTWNQDLAGQGIKSLRELSQGSTTPTADRMIMRPRRTQMQAAIPVPTSRNVVVLSAADSDVPSAKVSLAPATEGAVAVQLASGEFGTHKLTVPTEDGVSILLAIVDDTGSEISDTVKHRPIRGILQVKDTAVDGAAFDDANNAAQISFVTVNPSTFELEAADPASIGGKTIHYAYAQRQKLSTVPAVGFLVDGPGFVDSVAPVSSGGAAFKTALYEHSGATADAGTNVPAAGGLDFTASGLVFFDEGKPSARNVLVFLNGVLLRNGNDATPNSVRLGKNPAAGDLIFSSPLVAGDVVVAQAFVK